MILVLKLFPIKEKKSQEDDQTLYLKSVFSEDKKFILFLYFLFSDKLTPIYYIFYFLRLFKCPRNNLLKYNSEK